MYFGIDEAGKGSLFGPLVIGIAIINKDKYKKLNQIEEIKDSKKLTKQQREKLFYFLTNFLDYWDYILIEPIEINNLMSKGYKLTEIELLGIYKLIDKYKNKLTKGFIDSFYPNKNKLYEKLKNRYKNIEFVIDYKLDNKNKLVSSASIIAKVIRDNEIENIKKIIGLDIGSGYQSDEKTKNVIKDIEFLKKYKDFIRIHWKTVNKFINQKKIIDFI